MFSRSILCAGAALSTAPALAQQPAAPSWTPEIIVTAERPANYAIGAASITRTPVPLINTPQSIQVLTRTLLDEQQLFTLAEAVRNISGVVPALPSEAVLANPMVRGFESEVFVDGLIAYGDTAVVDPSSLSGVERIEVAKGPTSLLFGGGTGAPVGGLINIVTKVPTGDAHYAALIRAGSFGTIAPSIDIDQPLGDGFGIRVTGEYLNSNDDVDVVSIDRITVNPSLKATLGDDTDFVLRLGYSKVRQLEYAGLPAAVVDLPTVDPFRFSGATDAPRTEIENKMATGVLTHRFSDKVSATVQLRRYVSDFDEFGTFPFIAFFPPVGSTYVMFQGRLPVAVREWTADASMTAEFETGGISHVLLAGFQYDATDYTGAISFAPIGTLDYAVPGSDLPFGPIPDVAPQLVNEYRTTALYAQDQIRIGDRVHVLAGLRWSRLGQREVLGGVGTDVSRGRVDPRIGATIDLVDGVVLFGGWATGSRQAIFFNGGGAAPVPETSRVFEGGVKFALKDAGLSGTLAVFDQKRRNVPTADPLNPFASVQTGEQQSSGVEADLIWEPSRSLSVLASYAYTDARVTADTAIPAGDRLTRVPEHSGRLAVRYRIVDGALQGLGIGAGMSAASAAEITLPNSDRGDSYAVFDAQASYDIGRFRLGVSVANIFNSRYFIPYQYLAQSVLRPGQPRSAFVTLGARF
jgi:iron complex outermembrane receptor protein